MDTLPEHGRMASNTPYDGPIDPWSPYTLYDIVDNLAPDPDFESGEVPRMEYEGFHLLHLGGGEWQVQYDGHVGSIATLNSDDYDDVLELVADLNKYVGRLHEYEFQGDDAGLVEWAGRMATSDKQRAEEQPDRYIHVPEKARRE